MMFYSGKKRAAPTSSYYALVAADGANHLWKLNETSGTAAVDSIGAANGTYINSPTLGQVGPGGTSGILLDGTSQYVGNSTSIVTDTNFSYEMVFKTTVVQGILCQANNTGGTSANNYDKHCYMGSNSALNIGVYNGGARVANTTSPFADGNFHHLVLAFTTSSSLLYIDGSLAASMPYVSADIGSIPVFGAGNGGWPYANGSYFQGFIGSLATYPLALSATQATNHAAALGL